MNGIDKSIAQLAVDIDTLTPLDVNARRGNVNAIRASYEQFGQLKPIVAVRDNDDKLVVIAGNHQLEAARQLGWDKIAVSVVDLNSDDAIAYALADNRTSDLGTTDNSTLLDMINSINDRPVELFDALDWDVFSYTALETSVDYKASHHTDPNGGWTPPEIVVTNTQPVVPTFPVQPTVQAPQQPTRMTTDASTSDIVLQGSTATSASGSSNALVQYTLVFDSPVQQSRWYAFLRWLRENEDVSGDTTAERLMSYIDTVMN